ncbi:MAG: ATP-dependent RecD-like DNA helicase [Syntrophus sp. PtaU1.Bin208]|nr:MAG: ATP-dependent RecD-like DNA helicase [Syntrophus sp. PtaU1.Bin208]
MVDLQGHIERVTFSNEENGYTVARVKIPGRREPVTVVGGMINPTPGEKVRMKGEWTNHPRFGEQFRIVVCESSVPATVYGIEKYLGSGLIKGIGPVMARRMVEKFGEATLEVIESESSRLLEVEGIGEKRVAMILKAWEEQREIRAIMLFLQSHGVSSAYAARIFRQYGNAAFKVLQENPYRLATDIFGIGFLTADRIAEKMGFARDSRLRAEAGILFVLHELADEGHVLYPAEALIRKCEEILEIDPEIIASALEAAAGERRIVIEEGSAFPEAQPELIRDRAVYIRTIYPIYRVQNAVQGRSDCGIGMRDLILLITREKGYVEKGGTYPIILLNHPDYHLFYKRFLLSPLLTEQRFTHFSHSTATNTREDTPNTRKSSCRLRC